jgi:hypothetical protein
MAETEQQDERRAQGCLAKAAYLEWVAGTAAVGTFGIVKELAVNLG